MSYIRVRALDAGGMEAPSASRSDLETISSEGYAGREVTPDEIHVRQMLLCHDKYDRTGERFPVSYLKQFAATLPGKSMLANHDSAGYGGNLPLARFHSACTKRIDEPSFPILNTDVGTPDSDGDDDGDVARRRLKAASDGDVIPHFENQPARVNYLHAGFYFPNDPSTDSMRKHMDLGVHKHVSIGFRYDDLMCDKCGKSYLGYDCPHVLMQPDDEGRLTTGTYSGNEKNAEALEGSLVYLGAQPRARLIKQLQRGESIDVQAACATPYGEDLVAMKAAEFYARRFGHVQKSWSVGAGSDPFPPAILREVRANESAVEYRNHLLKTFGWLHEAAANPEPKPEADAETDTANETNETNEATDTARGAVSFATELETALGAVSGCVKRAQEIKAMRDAKDQSFSREREAQLGALHGELGALMAAIRPKEAGLTNAQRRQLMRMKAESDGLFAD